MVQAHVGPPPISSSYDSFVAAFFTPVELGVNLKNYNNIVIRAISEKIFPLSFKCRVMLENFTQENEELVIF